MTRKSLKQNLTIIWIVAIVLVAVAIAARFIGGEPAMAVYDIIKDMSLLIFTVVAASLAHTLQRRENFVDALRAEWYEIVKTKAAVLTYCEHPRPSELDYIATFQQLSQTIDTMRIVYRNVGETEELIGLYPYAPLHTMRRALQTIDPRKGGIVTASDRKAVKDLILQSFYALRERFLEELDLEEPSDPLLINRGRRAKVSGATRAAESRQARQDAAESKRHPYPAEMLELIARVKAIEERERASERRN